VTVLVDLLLEASFAEEEDFVPVPAAGAFNSGLTSDVCGSDICSTAAAVSSKADGSSPNIRARASLYAFSLSSSDCCCFTAATLALSLDGLRTERFIRRNFLGTTDELDDVLGNMLSKEMGLLGR